MKSIILLAIVVTLVFSAEGKSEHKTKAKSSIKQNAAPVKSQSPFGNQKTLQPKEVKFSQQYYPRGTIATH